MKEMVGGCCVCGDERGWNENPLVYCDGNGCNVAVHQACYGIVAVPTGPWYCEKCSSQERAARVRCELCPQKEGALKRTDNGSWAHVVCALYIPEVCFGNVTTMEPILLNMIPHERFNKVCYLCETKGRENKATVGACMTCNKNGCRQSFHVTCAQLEGLLCEEAGHYTDNVKYTGYCSHHYQKLRKDRDIKTIPPFRPSGNAYTPEKQSKTEKVRSKAERERRPRVGQTSVSTASVSIPLQTLSKPEEKKPEMEVEDVSPVSSNESYTNSSSHSSKFTNANFKETTITSQSVADDVMSAGENSLLSKIKKTTPNVEKKTKKQNCVKSEEESATNSPKSVADESQEKDIEDVKHLHDIRTSTPVSLTEQDVISQRNPRVKKSSSREQSRSSTPAIGTPVVVTETVLVKDLPVRGESSQTSEIPDIDLRPSREEDTSVDVTGVDDPIMDGLNDLSSIKSEKKPTLDHNSDETLPADSPPLIVLNDNKPEKHKKHKKQGREPKEGRAKSSRKSRDGDDASVRRKRRKTSSSMLRTYGPMTAYGISAGESAIQDVFSTAGQSGLLVGPPRPNSNRMNLGDNNAGAPSMPSTMEELLEKQWDQSSDFLMNQAASSHLDIASLLSCLHQIREENLRLEQHISQLVQRRDHLVTVNSRLSLPLNHNAHHTPHNSQLQSGGPGGDGGSRSKSPRYNNVMHSQTNNLNSSHGSSSHSLNQSNQSLHQSLSQSFNQSFNANYSPGSRSSNPAHHPQSAGNPSSSHPHSHQQSPSTVTSTSSMPHTNYSSQTNHNHSSGVNHHVVQQLPNSSSKRLSMSPSYGNTIVLQTGYPPGVTSSKSNDRTKSSPNYVHYIPGNTGLRIVSSPSETTLVQHSKLTATADWTKGSQNPVTQSLTASHTPSHRPSSIGSQDRKPPSGHSRSGTPHAVDKTPASHQMKREVETTPRQEPRTNHINATVSQGSAMIPLTVLTPHQQVGAAMPPNITPQQHHMFQMMLPHTQQASSMVKTNLMINLAATDSNKGSQRSKSPRNDKKHDMKDKA